MSCNECDGVLLPLNGSSTNIESGHTSTRHVYCAKCGQMYAVKRKNVSVKQVGNVQEKYEVDDE